MPPSSVLLSREGRKQAALTHAHGEQPWHSRPQSLPRFMMLSALGTETTRQMQTLRQWPLRPWSIEKHLCRSCFCSKKALLSHATCILVCFCSGKSNPYCEISMGSQSYTTRTLQDTLNPKWNFNCQFFIKDLYQDVLCLTMFDRDQFSPDGKV